MSSYTVKTPILPSVLLVLVGVTAALHVGKLPPALTTLHEVLGVTLVQAGFLLSLVQVAGMLGGLVLGLTADNLGLRRSLLLGTSLLALASAAGAQATTPAGLLLSRAVEGVGFLLTVLPVPGLLRRLEPLQRLNRMLGLWSCYMGIGMGTALLIGPGLIELLGWQGWWWILTGWSLAMLPCVLLGVPADPPKNKHLAQPESWQHKLLITLRSPGPWLIAICFGLYSSQWLAVVGFLPTIYLQAGLSGGLVGVLTAAVAIINVVGNLSAGQLLYRGWAAWHLLVLGFCSAGLFTFLAYASFSADLPWLRFVAVMLFSALSGFIPGALFALAVQLAPSEGTIATTVGWMQQWSSLGQFSGPPLVALLAAQVGGWHLTWYITVVFSALGVVLAWHISRLVLKKSQQSA